MKTRGIFLVSILCAVLVSGCSLAPPHVKPSSPVPGEWAMGDNSGGQAWETEDLAWEAFILDGELRSLVDRALVGNRNLRQVILNIKALEAQYRIQHADVLPSLALGATGERKRVSGDYAEDGNAETSSAYQVGLTMNAFELDFWGRVKNLSDAALEEYLASREGTRNARIALVSQVAQAYMTRVGAAEQYELIAKTLAARDASLNLMIQKRDSGAASDLDVEEARSLLAQARADLEAMSRALNQADNKLMLLVGSASPLEIKGGDHPRMVADVTPGLSSQLLLRRPDIQAAEHRLKSRNAQVGAARAAFFPAVSLTGLGGSASTELSGLFGSGTFAWQFIPRISLPIFNSGRNRSNLDLAKVRKDVAVAAYEERIQIAFKEVADALVARDTLGREEEYRRQLADSSTRSLALARVRYEQGVDSHLRYLDAQRNDFANQIRLIQTRTQSRMARVQVFTALGGGWPATS